MHGNSGPLRWLIVFILVVSLFFPSGSAEIAIASEGISTQPASAPESAPATPPAPEASPSKPEEPNVDKNLIKEDKTKDKNNVDKVHNNLEQGILEQVIRFDNFFGNPKGEEERKTGYRMQLRDFIRVDQKGNLKYALSIRANAKLSNISERVRLYISGDNTVEPAAIRLPEDPGNPGFDRPSTAVTARIANTELRFGFLETPLTYIFLGAGFTFVIPPETFVRTRVQHIHHINDFTIVRAAETLFVNNVAGLGESTEVIAERLLTPKTLLRWSSTGTVSNRIPGMEWASELSLTQQLSPKSAISFAGGVNGVTSFDDVTSNYGLLARYRRNFLISWLFYETGPDIIWQRQIIDRRFLINYGMSFALEVVFKGNSSELKNKLLKP